MCSFYPSRFFYNVAGMAGSSVCEMCGAAVQQVQAGRRRRFCSDACRQKAYRRRQANRPHATSGRSVTARRRARGRQAETIQPHSPTQEQLFSPTIDPATTQVLSSALRAREAAEKERDDLHASLNEAHAHIKELEAARTQLALTPCSHADTLRELQRVHRTLATGGVLSTSDGETLIAATNITKVFHGLPRRQRKKILRQIG